MARTKAAQKSYWRAVHGVLLLDKPGGMSSNAALQKARHLFRADKGGHTGSLDPLATGLLPLCFGEATKIAGLLLGSAKAYETELRLGISTDTLDADGVELDRRAVPELDRPVIERLLASFVGEQLQIPPVYSAIKRDGVPAYRRARDGEVLIMEPRRVRIDAIELIELGADTLRLRVSCGSGTYIRSLVRDLGEALGCGAHVTALRRLWVEPFLAPAMWTIEQLQDMDEADRLACLLPLEAGLRHLPALALDAEQALKLRQGQRLPSAYPADEYIGWLEGAAVGRFSVDADGLIQPDRLFMAPTNTAG